VIEGSRVTVWLAALIAGTRPTLLAEGTAGDIGLLSLAWSADGREVLYYSHHRREIICVDVGSGTARSVSLPADLGLDPRIYPSQDGILLLVCSSAPEEGQQNVWILGADNGQATHLPWVCGGTVAWSPDSSRVVLELDLSAGGGLCVVDVASGASRGLTAEGMPDEVADGTAWTSDGRIFFLRAKHALMSIREDGSSEIVVFPLGR
jgi:Tol biopolymer transport system component